MHADSSGAVEEERPGERSSGQEKGTTSYTTNRHTHSSFDSPGFFRHDILDMITFRCKEFYSNKHAVFFSAESVLCPQEAEYNLLEEELQKTLSDLGRREKQLAEAELEVRTHNIFIWRHSVKKSFKNLTSATVKTMRCRQSYFCYQLICCLPLQIMK